MKNRFLILLSFVLIVGRDVVCANTSMVRERININRDWRYQIDDPDGVGAALHYSRLKPYLLPCANDFIIFGKRYQRPEGNPGENIAYVKSDFDDSEWRHLNLPHDWAIEGPFNIDYNGSTGKLPYWGIRWYRKTLELSQDDAGKQIYLDIDGAMSYVSVWCNGQYVGGWPYGYASFRLDLTPYIKAGQKNVLAIRLDNPDDTSRWYPGSGIYRNVWLVKTSPVHVEQWGTFVRNQQVDSEIAVMEMGVNIENHAGEDVQVKLQTSVYLQGKDGRPVGEEVTQSMTKDIAIKKDSWSSARFQFKVDKPKLWDIDTPNCYVAVSRVFMDGKEMDSYETPFGIRTIEFTHNQGFMLNGQKVAIKGVCMHHDLGALGAAFNEVAAERQLRIMKEMDYNGSTGKLPYWGIRWYRKTLELSQDDAGKQIYLDIDGAMSYVSVWCNGQYVGGWPYGYASFRLDLTPYIKAGQKNVLAIRLDNPDDTSRWYPGSGIYRNVWLVKTSPVHVEQWGTFVRNQQVDSEIAVMEMGVNIENHAGEDVQVKLQTSVYLQGKDGRPVGEEVTQSMTKDIAIKKDSWSSARFQFKVDKPKLWDIDTPNCYVAVSRVFMDGKEMDSYETPFGIRTIEFTHNQGFMLNGQKVAIKGVCMHHDLGALGAAFNEVAAERQLRIMKEMGANAIRTSHNPPAPELVALCDRMG